MESRTLKKLVEKLAGHGTLGYSMDGAGRLNIIDRRGRKLHFEPADYQDWLEEIKREQAALAAERRDRHDHLA